MLKTFTLYDAVTVEISPRDIGQVHGAVNRIRVAAFVAVELEIPTATTTMTATDTSTATKSYKERTCGVELLKRACLRKHTE